VCACDHANTGVVSFAMCMRLSAATFMSDYVDICVAKAVELMLRDKEKNSVQMLCRCRVCADCKW
jgi:hypothetical protein